ncbi:MAG TPA: ABC transporter permease subunit, partial [Actinomycetota bacterium]|nr:ABC transporter permease subunit [Actinomycetota bacterium]
MSRGTRYAFGLIWPPILFGVVFLLLWELAVEVFDFQPYFLPAPSAIWDAFRANTSLIWEATKVSGLNAFIGLLVGTVIGVAMAFLLARFRLVEDLLTPLAVALNAIPIFVLVAVFNNMYPVTSEVPRRLMVTFVVYFIVLINVARGLREVGTVYLDLMRSYAASEVTILRKVRVPHAVPYLFTALKIAAAASVVGTIIGEGPGGVQQGLGRAILTFNQQYITGPEKLWATIIAAS